MLQCSREMVLEDILTLISKKKKVKMLLPKAYKFLYMTEAETSEGTLEMRTPIADLKSEELRLVNKFAAGAGGSAAAAAAQEDVKFVATTTGAADPDPSQFIFTAVRTARLCTAQCAAFALSSSMGEY
jgi:hypothetical protein